MRQSITKGALEWLAIVTRYEATICYRNDESDQASATQRIDGAIWELAAKLSF